MNHYLQNAEPLQSYLQHVYLRIYIWIQAKKKKKKRMLFSPIFMSYPGPELKLLFKKIC